MSEHDVFSEPMKKAIADARLQVHTVQQLCAEIERLKRDNEGLLGQVKYWQRTYGAAQEELVELRDKAAKAAGGEG